MSILRQISTRQNILYVLPVMQPTCGCNKLSWQRNNKLPINMKQKRCSSYYTFPLFTGAQYLIENFHHYLAMPWWGTIICSTLILRTVVTLPLAIKQHKYLAKMELLKPTLKGIIVTVRNDAVARGHREGKERAEIKKDAMKQVALYTKDFQKFNGITPMKLFLLPWLQMPLWITVSLALRNISGFVPKDLSNAADIYLPSPGIETEGLLWLSNLSIPDPFYILPLVLLTTNLLNIELSTMRQQAPSMPSKIFTVGARVLTVWISIVSTQVPSAMSLYWVTSSSYGLAQNLAMKFPKIRRKLRIPKTPLEYEKPLVHISDVIKARKKRFLEIQRKQ